MGYGSSEDTWEPLDGLSNCKEVLKDFEERGYKLSPLSRDANFTCRGPPCQGASGFNHFRNRQATLEDVKPATNCLYGYHRFSETQVCTHRECS